MSLPLQPQYRHPLATAHGLWGGDLAHPRGSAHVGHLEAWQTCRALRRPSVFLLLCLPACPVDHRRRVEGHVLVLRL